MSLDKLILQTRERFPHYSHAAVEIVPLEKGGSDRRYYRIGFSAEYSLILVKYNPARKENERFVALANFLGGIGVNAPFIYFCDSEQGLIWMQDLGEEDLWHHRSESWPVRRRLYESTLEEVAGLHGTNLELVHQLNLQPGFDESLYRWEQNYCLENCFGRCFQREENELSRLRRHPVFLDMARQLASYPRVLVHRDFQSQNVIIWDDQVYLIDFQGMRPGLAQYDLASLLYDPYVQLTEKERDHLVRFYFQRAGAGWTYGEFYRVFLQCAIQRLMQALGAYGYLGLVGLKPDFLRHIRPAIASLAIVARKLDGLSFFADWLEQLPQKPSNSKS
jgi:aminoglycoside/choline kinase family phosphotransferase